MNRIKELRDELGIPQQALASQMKISQTALGNYERGIREMDFTLVKKLSDFFKVTTDYLMGYSPMRFPHARITGNVFVDGLATTFANTIEPHMVRAQLLDSEKDKERGYDPNAFVDEVPKYAENEQRVYALVSNSIDQLAANLHLLMPIHDKEE